MNINDIIDWTQSLCEQLNSGPMSDTIDWSYELEAANKAFSALLLLRSRMELTAPGDDRHVIVSGDGGLEDATDYGPDEVELAMDGDRAFLRGFTIGDKCRSALAHGVSIHEIAEVFGLSETAKQQVYGTQTVVTEYRDDDGLVDALLGLDMSKHTKELPIVDGKYVIPSDW
jgi:hypothetical protein